MKAAEFRSALFDVQLEGCKYEWKISWWCLAILAAKLFIWLIFMATVEKIPGPTVIKGNKNLVSI